MSLVGKTIVRESDYGDTLYFEDGTSLHVSSDDGHWVQERDAFETQAALHAEQGHRERDRMRRLHDTLHSRDKEHLARLAREKWQRDYEAASPLGKATMVMYRDMLEVARRDFNRMAFFSEPLEPSKRKRKARRS